MAQVIIPPPPTYASPIIEDPVTKDGSFNPIWLNWFLQVAAVLSTLSTNANPVHENLPDLLGGTAGEHYHFTAAQHDALLALLTPPP